MQIQLNVLETKKSFNKNLYDVVVIGSGPGGMNASLYAKRKGLDVLLIGLQTGVQLINSSDVDNYIGSIHLTGAALRQEFLKHIQSADVEYHSETEVSQLTKNGEVFNIQTMDGQEVSSKTVILATGGNPRHLGLDKEEYFANRGLSYCAICDAPLFAGKEVAVVGGGNSAVEAAIDLAKVSKQVTVVHRSLFRADKPLMDKLYSLENVEVFLGYEVKELIGDSSLEKIVIKSNQDDSHTTLEVGGLFIEIGLNPNSELVQGMVDLNDRKEVIVDDHKKTSVDGLYAIGDVSTSEKQIIVAASDGALAALAANSYINQMKGDTNGKII